jgi:RNA polymerase sigma factor (sigma-70 family)
VVTDAGKLDREDGDGVSRLYRLHAAWLARRLRPELGPEDADDVVQETYIRAAPYAADIRHPKAFLLKIARNLIRDAGRREARRQAGQAGLEQTDSEAATQVDTVLLSQIVLRMPALYRDVFVLSRFRDMTYPEIARLLDISVKTVEWRMARAVEYCASRLEL